MKRVMAGLIFVAAALGAADADARILGKRDLTELANEAADAVVVEDFDTIRSMLSAQGLPPEEVKATSAALTTRLVRDIRNYVGTLEGVSFPSFDEAERHVLQRRLIYRFSALNSPALYAQGRPLTYAVNDAEAARMERGLMATWIEREPLLRKKLDDMLMMNEIANQDVAAVRAWTRKLAIERGKRTIRLMRGARFFSAADADYFLECAISAEIETVRAELADPRGRAAFIEAAVVEFGAREEGAAGYVPMTAKRPIDPFDDPPAASAPTSALEEKTAAIDFNK